MDDTGTSMGARRFGVELEMKAYVNLTGPHVVVMCTTTCNAVDVDAVQVVMRHEGWRLTHRSALNMIDQLVTMTWTRGAPESLPSEHARLRELLT